MFLAVFDLELRVARLHLVLQLLEDGAVGGGELKPGDRLLLLHLWYRGRRLRRQLPAAAALLALQHEIGSCLMRLVDVIHRCLRAGLHAPP